MLPQGRAAAPLPLGPPFRVTGMTKNGSVLERAPDRLAVLL